jgi:hypothetical protein
MQFLHLTIIEFFIFTIKIIVKNVYPRIRKKTFYLQFCIRNPEGHQKRIFNTPKMKTKIHMGSIRQSLQAQPKTVKKLSKHQINQSKEKKSQIKVCLVL